MRLKKPITCVALAPLLTGAAQPVKLQPSSPWIVDYAESSCRLARNFGPEKTMTKLAFESDSPDSMDLLVVGRPLQTDEERVQARFLPARGSTFEGTVAETADKGIPAILWGRVRMLSDEVIDREDEKQKLRHEHPKDRPPPIDLSEEVALRTQELQFADATTELEIQTRRNRPVILETGSLGDALRTFQKCIRDSQKDWGVDPDVEDRIVRPVWALNPDGWLNARDYPPALVQAGKESVLSVRLLIDANGKVTNCTPLSHYAETDFGKISCRRIAERARFAPAELADGSHVPSYYVRGIQFRIAR